DQVTLTAWCTRLSVWPTVTFRFLKSSYMKLSGLLGSRDWTPVRLSAPSSPCDQDTLRAEDVSPLPVTWSTPPAGAAPALAGGPRGADGPEGHQRDERRAPAQCAGHGRAPGDTDHGAPLACRWRRRADMCAMSGGPRPSPSSNAAARAISVTRKPSPRLAEA